MQKVLFRVWPLILICFIWFIFASPYFLKGRIPYPSTYQVNNFAPWDAYSKFAGPVKNGAMPDIITQIYPWKYFTIQTWKSGQVPLWNPNSFSGTPHLANYQSAVLSPFNVLFFILPFIDAWSLLVLFQPLLAGFFMYIFVRSLRVGKEASLLASISFMFCGFITVWMGYATLGYAILFLPLALYSIERYCQTQKFRFLLLLSISMPLSFFSGHFQISVYFLLTTLFYISYKLFVTKNMRNTLYLILYIFFGLLLSMPQLLPSVEFYIQSFRSNIFEKGEVIPWSYIPTLLAPDFFGNPVTRNDWFGHYAEWNAYFGVIPLMLAFYAIINKKIVQTFFLFVLGLLAVLLSFQTPLLDFLINLHIPVLSTSSASRIIVVYSFLFAVLSAFGFEQLILDLGKKKRRKILIWLIGFLFLILLLWGIVFLNLFMPLDKVAVAKSNLKFPTIIFALGSFAILLSLISRKLLFFTTLSLLSIVSFDMLRFANKWMPFDPRNLVFSTTPTAEGFSKIAGYSRAIGNFGGEGAIYYHLSSLEGYDALYIKKYAEFMSFVQNGKPQNLNRSVVSFAKTGIYTPWVIDLLDVKYAVHKLADDHAGWTFPYWAYPKDQFKLIYKDQAYEFYQNTKAFPHAFLVGKYRVIYDSQKQADMMFSKNFDLRKEVVLSEDPKLSQTTEDIGWAKITNYKQNSIDIVTEAKDNALLFLADPYYSGWAAKVDGANVSIYRADYAFRAIPVEKGKHKINFTYDPWSFKMGVVLALLGVMVMLYMFLIPKILAHLRLISSSQKQKDK